MNSERWRCRECRWEGTREQASRNPRWGIIVCPRCWHRSSEGRLEPVLELGEITVRPDIKVHLPEVETVEGFRVSFGRVCRVSINDGDPIDTPHRTGEEVAEALGGPGVPIGVALERLFGRPVAYSQRSPAYAPLTAGDDA